MFRFFEGVEYKISRVGPTPLAKVAGQPKSRTPRVFRSSPAFHDVIFPFADTQHRFQQPLPLKLFTSMYEIFFETKGGTKTSIQRVHNVTCTRPRVASLLTTSVSTRIQQRGYILPQKRQEPRGWNPAAYIDLLTIKLVPGFLLLPAIAGHSLYTEHSWICYYRRYCHCGCCTVRPPTYVNRSAGVIHSHLSARFKYLRYNLESHGYRIGSCYLVRSLTDVHF